MLVRKAVNADKQGIVNCLVESFYNTLKLFSNDKGIISQFLMDTINFDSFWVIEDKNNIAGCLSIVKHPQLLGKVNYKKARKLAGFIKGAFVAKLLEGELNEAEQFSNDAYVNMVSIHPDYQGKGLSKILLAESLKLMPYNTAVLNVVDTNEKAHALYKKLGFVEFMRKPEMFKKQAGFNEKIFMRYSK